MKRKAGWCLCVLFSDRYSEVEISQVKLALPVLAVLINNQDEDVIFNACRVLYNFSCVPYRKIQEIIESNVCPRLVELLNHSSLKLFRKSNEIALGVVGNIVTGDDAQTQVIVDCNALECLLKLLNSPKESIRKEACWTISNIAAGNTDQIQVVNEMRILIKFSLSLNFFFNFKYRLY